MHDCKTWCLCRTYIAGLENRIIMVLGGKGHHFFTEVIDLDRVLAAMQRYIARLSVDNRLSLVIYLPSLLERFVSIEPLHQVGMVGGFCDNEKMAIIFQYGFYHRLT